MKSVLNKHFHDLMSPKGGRGFLEYYTLATLTCHTALSRLVKFQLVRSRTALAKVFKFQLAKTCIWCLISLHLSLERQVLA